jgi:thiosulfate dehydrogenase
VNANPRPDSPGKEHDWPLGGAPADVPYATRSGHVAHRPPPLLPRANPRGAVVPPPASVARR